MGYNTRVNSFFWVTIAVLGSVLAVPQGRCLAQAPARGVPLKTVRLNPLACKQLKDATGGEYYLYHPKKLEKNRPYWLVIAVHGLGGTGKYAAGYLQFATFGNCIVAAPTFPGGRYMFCTKPDAQRTIDLINALKKEFLLHDKCFIAGFSGGSQFAHRFALKHPEHVIGCSPHAGGSWSTGEMMPSDAGLLKNDKVNSIPFGVSCGLADGRWRGAQHFVGAMLKQKNCVKEMYWKGMGHTLDQRVVDLSKETFFLAAYGLGVSDGIRMDKKIGAICRMIRGARTYVTPVAQVRRILKIPYQALPKEARATNGAKRDAKPHASGWYPPGNDPAWFEKHFKRCRQRWVDRLIKPIADRALAEIQGKGVKKASPAQVALIRKAFKDCPKVLARIDAAAGQGPDDPKTPTSTPTPNPGKADADRQCSSWWRLAQSYAACGRPEKSKTYLKMIIKKHPKTDWATKAAKRLDELP
ncbi:MAG: hypothetical protein HN350_08970 [Phycisphaerales bacterium]|jgi:predicted esterase|nr:hypothetical protein [Phycisphaerales bacterium]